MPTLNAVLNTTSATLLLVGFWSIKGKREVAHARFMIGACLVSTLFFLSYGIYHAHVGSVRFTGTGWVRPVYFTILVSHTILAVVIVPLVLRTVFLAGHRRFEAHRVIARVTLPLWLYVCVTGVVVYGMLYHGSR